MPHIKRTQNKCESHEIPIKVPLLWTTDQMSHKISSDRMEYTFLTCEFVYSAIWEKQGKDFKGWWKWKSKMLSQVGLFATPWNYPGQSTGIGSLSLLQIFPTQGLNPGLLHCRRILYQLNHKGSPRILDGWPIPSPGDFPNPGMEPHYRWILYQLSNQESPLRLVVVFIPCNWDLRIGKGFVNHRDKGVLLSPRCSWGSTQLSQGHSEVDGRFWSNIPVHWMNTWLLRKWPVCCLRIGVLLFFFVFSCEL